MKKQFLTAAGSWSSFSMATAMTLVRRVANEEQIWLRYSQHIAMMILDSVQAVAILVKEGGIGAFRDSSSVKDVN